MTILITYERISASPGKVGLEDELKRIGKWWHHLSNVWIVETNETTTQLYNRIIPYFTTEDHVLVVRISKDYQGWLPKAAWDWLSSLNY